MRIVLLGPPGSGKAELSRHVSEHYGMPVITVASVMQKAAAEQTELGRLAKEAMDSARVSDELLLALLRIQLPQTDLGKGFVLVDLPKNAGQADVLDSVLNDLGATIDAVINLEVDPDELMERLVGRIACDNCGAQYNLYVNPPMVDGVCDACGARVVRRPDDYEETISNRLRVYEAQMGPLLQYYELTDKLHRVAADHGIAKAWPGVRKLIDGLPPSAAPGSVEVAESASVRPARKKTAKAKAQPAAAKRAGAIKAAARKADSERIEKAPKAAKKKPAAKKAASGTATKTSKAASGKKAVTAEAPAAKKTTAKKATAKKVAVKKATAKKAAANKVTAKKTAAKKKVAKKTVTKKAPAAKKLTKKLAAKKVAVKKSAAKKATKKTTARKVPANKAPVGKATASKAAKKKVVAKKVAAKKAAAKKVTARKVSAKKTAAKKTAAKKGASRKR